MSKSPKYNHAFDIAFVCLSNDPEGKDVTPDQIRKAVRARVESIDDDELMEAVGAPFDSYRIADQ